MYSFCESKSLIKNEIVLVFMARYLYLSKKKKAGCIFTFSAKKKVLFNFIDKKPKD